MSKNDIEIEALSTKAFQNASAWRLANLLIYSSWKKNEFCIKRMNKKEIKDREKRVKEIRKYHVDKNKEKEGILCEACAFCTVQGVF